MKVAKGRSPSFNYALSESNFDLSVRNCLVLIKHKLNKTNFLDANHP